MFRICSFNPIFSQVLDTFPGLPTKSELLFSECYWHLQDILQDIIWTTKTRKLKSHSEGKTVDQTICIDWKIYVNPCWNGLAAWPVCYGNSQSSVLVIFRWVQKYEPHDWQSLTISYNYLCVIFSNYSFEFSFSVESDICPTLWSPIWPQALCSAWLIIFINSA
jgi:hypothetical protein